MPAKPGEAIWRTLDIGDLRVRMVEYTPGYLADHWCDRGHVLYVLEGELDTELRDGRTFKLTPGMSYQVSDHGDAAHRSSTTVRRKIVHRGLSNDSRRLPGVTTGTVFWQPESALDTLCKSRTI